MHEFEPDQMVDATGLVLAAGQSPLLRATIIAPLEYRLATLANLQMTSTGVYQDDTTIWGRVRENDRACLHAADCLVAYYERETRGYVDEDRPGRQALRRDVATLFASAAFAGLQHMDALRPAVTFERMLKATLPADQMRLLDRLRQNCDIGVYPADYQSGLLAVTSPFVGSSLFSARHPRDPNEHCGGIDFYADTLQEALQYCLEHADLEQMVLGQAGTDGMLEAFRDAGMKIFHTVDRDVAFEIYDGSDRHRFVDPDQAAAYVRTRLVPVPEGIAP